MAQPSRVRRRIAYGVALAALALASCRKTDSEGAYADQSSDSMDVVGTEAALVAAGSEGVETSMTAEDAANAAAAQANTFFQPASCVTATVNLRTITYTLNDCTGKYGLFHTTGTVIAEYTREADGLHYHVTSQNLDVEGPLGGHTTVNIDTKGVYSVVGTTKTVVATMNGSGTGPRGTSFTREGGYTLTWDPTTSCFGLDGEWMSTVGTAAWTTTVDGFDRCGNACPADGGSITWVGRNGLTLELEYDGSDVAHWSTSRGRSGTVDLFCDPDA